MKKFVTYLLVLVLMVLLEPTVKSQEETHYPPTYCCGPQYTYCESLREPTETAQYIGFYKSRWLFESECNTTGNFFFGNTIEIRQWGTFKVFWYNWAADPLAGQKIAWWHNHPWEPVTVTYDPQTMRAISVTSVTFP